MRIDFSAISRIAVFGPAPLQIVPLLRRGPDPGFEDPHEFRGHFQNILLHWKRHVRANWRRIDDPVAPTRKLFGTAQEDRAVKTASQPRWCECRHRRSAEERDQAALVNP